VECAYDFPVPGMPCILKLDSGDSFSNRMGSGITKFSGGGAISKEEIKDL